MSPFSCSVDVTISKGINRKYFNDFNLLYSKHLTYFTFVKNIFLVEVFSTIVGFGSTLRLDIYDTFNNLPTYNKRIIVDCQRGKGNASQSTHNG